MAGQWLFESKLFAFVLKIQEIASLAWNFLSKVSNTRVIALMEIPINKIAFNYRRTKSWFVYMDLRRRGQTVELFL